MRFYTFRCIMDVEKFISLVHEHRCLWDHNDNKYNSRDHQRRAWSEISDVMEISEDELRKKWRGLRDTYGRELKKFMKRTTDADAEPESRWTYFKSLMFLRDTITRRDQTESCYVNISDGNIGSDSDSDSDLDHTKEIFASPLLKRVKTEKMNEIEVQVQQNEMQSQGDSGLHYSDKQFLQSLLPFLKDVPKHRKLVVRCKLQQVLIDEQNET